MLYCNNFFIIMFYIAIHKLLNLYKNNYMIADDIQKRLGKNVKRFRKSKDPTQFQLAEKTGISEETVKNIELSRCWTSDKNLAKITEALDVDIYKLFLPIESSIVSNSKDIEQIKRVIIENLRNYIDTSLEKLT